ncbi:N-acyl homoserine lactonase family protein [Rudaeicoccus suwonensis]|uniref:N-acyl homoserine lactone hydrolase n=1 Tax=Rudaeicoccus suwonensis TaxID=657409 RepID=A0A561E926_9MICO|nr:N-acyl homoserine lactonase family protein [Rudaeicoccus suwonensis]TWE12123.1 N-acyl homoserine lactone hydrolase [Rudaeicoccus suwonensis]
MRIDDVRRVRFGSFVRPAEETGSGAPRVEEVLGYVASTPAGILLLDTGLGDAGVETDEWYRPVRIGIDEALASVGLRVEDIDVVVNCHLHFDHIGANPVFGGVPIHCQRVELDAAQAPDYTATDLVDFPRARYELLDGEAEIAPGVHVIPTPGHVDGHQSVVLECADGSVVLAGQAHDTASGWSSDLLAAQARSLGHDDPLPLPSPWMERLLRFDPRRVVFAHDSAVWVP